MLQKKRRDLTRCILMMKAIEDVISNDEDNATVGKKYEDGGVIEA